MELTGQIKLIFDTQNVSASFRKRELVLVTPGRYPQQILVEFTQDKISLLEPFSPGDEVTIQIDIRGREWNSPRGDTKYFVSIQGWRIEPVRQAQPDRQHDGPQYDGPRHDGPHDGGSGSGPATDGPPAWHDVPPPDSADGSDSAPDDDIPF